MESSSSCSRTCNGMKLKYHGTKSVNAIILSVFEGKERSCIIESLFKDSMELNLEEMDGWGNFRDY